MKNFSNEQEAIIEHVGNGLVTACAGSGKTYTAKGYASRRENGLYFVYNKKIADETKKAITNCKVTTGHALAFNYLGINYTQIGELSNAIIESYFENSVALGYNQKLINRIVKNSIDNFTKVNDSEEDFFEKNDLYNCCDDFKNLLSDMRLKKVKMLPDFYLKMFSEKLTKEKINLGYDYIIVDEAQDLNSPLIKIVESQPCTKIYLGDSMQSIYSFNKCVNAFEILDYPILPLSNSYRYNSNVANLANQCAGYSKLLNPDFKLIMSKGLGKKVDKTYCHIFNTNFGVYNKIMDLKGQCNVNGTYDWKKTIQDMWDLSNLGKKNSISSPFFKIFDSQENFKAWMVNSENYEYAGALLFVQEHGRNGLMSFAKYIEVIKKYKGNVTVSNTHKAKGLEWGHVELGNDFTNILSFTNKNSLDELISKNKSPQEEINKIYVAITRGQETVILPDNLKEAFMPTKLTNCFN
jgi:superfamily I DNA/RNA helicase